MSAKVRVLAGHCRYACLLTMGKIIDTGGMFMYSIHLNVRASGI
jgi:hypothetical protein